MANAFFREPPYIQLSSKGPTCRPPPYPVHSSAIACITVNWNSPLICYLPHVLTAWGQETGLIWLCISCTLNTEASWKMFSEWMNEPINRIIPSVSRYLRHILLSGTWSCKTSPGTSQHNTRRQYMILCKNQCFREIYLGGEKRRIVERITLKSPFHIWKST